MIHVTIRRKPVPREWREENHYLTLRTRRMYGVVKGSGHRSRSRGTCSCGAQWPASEGSDNLHADDVRDYWLDHVAKAYHGDDYYIRKEEET